MSLPTHSVFSGKSDVMPPENLEKEFEGKLYKKVVLRIIPLFMLCYLFANLDRVNISFAKLQMLEELNFTDAIYAFGASVFFWGYFIFEMPANIILHKLGARRWLAFILFIWGIISTLTLYIEPVSKLLGIAPHYTFYTLRLLLGICEAGFYPGVILYLNYWFPARIMSRATSMFVLALPVASVLGGPLSGWIMEFTHNAGGMSGWQWMMLIEGIPASLLGIVLFCYLSNGISDAKWLSKDEKTLLLQNLQDDNLHKEHHVAAALKDPRVWLLCLIILMFNTGYYGMTFWLPSILKASGIEDVWHIGLLSAIPYLFGAIAMILIPLHSRKVGERRLHVAIPPLAGGIALILSAWCIHFNVSISVAFMVIAAIGLFGMMPIFWTLPGSLLSGTAAAAGIAMINSFGALSGFVGSFLSNMAQELTGDINNGTYLLGACLLICSGLVMLIPKIIFINDKPLQ